MGQTVDIALIEFHDARIATIGLVKGGKAEVIFDHLAVYVAVGPDLYDVWSYSGKLLLDGVRGFALSGEMSGDDYASDVTFEPALEMQPGTRSEVRSMRIEFGSGATAAFRLAGIELELVERLERVEQWRGRL